MNNIADQQVAPRGDLDFNAKPGNQRRIVTEAFDPINVPRLVAFPVCPFFEFRIKQLTDDSSPVRLRLLFDGDLCGKEDFLNLKEDVRKSQSASSLSRPPVEA